MRNIFLGLSVLGIMSVSTNCFAQKIEKLDKNYQLTAVENEKDWKIQVAEFNFAEVRNPNRNSQEEVTTADGSGWWGSELILVNRDIIGSIYIREINPLTYGTRITQINNVWYRLRSYGLNIRAGLYKNTKIPLRNLEGKSVKDIFSRKFYGGKIAVQLGLLLNLAPNLSYMQNANGIIIPDLEQWVGVGVGIGLNVTYMDGQFYFRNNLGSYKTATHTHTTSVGDVTTEELNKSEILEKNF